MRTAHLKKNTGCGGLLARPGTCTRRAAALDFSKGVVYQHHHPIIGRDVELEALTNLLMISCRAGQSS